MKCSKLTSKGTRCTREATVDGLCGQHAALATLKKGWTEKFLDGFRDRCTVSGACEVAGVDRSTAYRERQRNEEFALAWHDLEQETTDTLEREAFRRAAEGVEEPVYHRGEEVGHVRKYSDTLLIFLLKARKPEMYRETHRFEHSGPNGAPIEKRVVQEGLSNLPIDEREQLLELSRKAAA